MYEVCGNCGEKRERCKCNNTNNITINCGCNGSGVGQDCIDMRDRLLAVPTGTKIAVNTESGTSDFNNVSMGTVTGFTFTVTKPNGDIATINICQVTDFTILKGIV